jgi:hypothetical protein
MSFYLSHAKSDTIADFTGTATVLNVSGNTTTVLATDLVRPSDWNSSHAWNVSPEYYEPFILAATNSTLSAQGVGTWYLDPFVVPMGMGVGQINLMMVDAAGFLNGTTLSAASSGSVSRYQTMNTQLAIYSMGTGANYSSMGTVWSREVSILATWSRAVGTTTTNQLTATNALTLSFPAQYDSTGGMTYSTVSQSGSLSVGASTMVSSSINSIIQGALAYGTGSKMIPVGITLTLPPGEYYLGMMISSTSSSTGTNYSLGTMFSTQSILGMFEFNNAGYKRMGVLASDSSTANPAFHGTVATTSTSPVGTLRTSDMRNQGVNNARRAWFFQQSNY